MSAFLRASRRLSLSLFSLRHRQLPARHSGEVFRVALRGSFAAGVFESEVIVARGPRGTSRVRNVLVVAIAHCGDSWPRRTFQLGVIEAVRRISAMIAALPAGDHRSVTKEGSGAVQHGDARRGLICGGMAPRNASAPLY